MSNRFFWFFQQSSEMEDQLAVFKEQKSLIQREASKTQAMLVKVITQIKQSSQYQEKLQDYISEQALPAIQKLELTDYKSRQQVIDLGKWRKNLKVTQQEITICESQIETLNNQKEQLTCKKQELEDQLKMIDNNCQQLENRLFKADSLNSKPLKAAVAA